MNKIRYSKEVDVLLIEISEESIAYAEEEENTILHYSHDGNLVLIEILDFRQSMTEQSIQELIAC